MADSEQFYKLTPNIAKTLQQAKLTRVEMNLWLYLISLQPWEDGTIPIDPGKVQRSLEIKNGTYYRAIAKLEQVGLFQFSNKGHLATNRLGNKVTPKNGSDSTKSTPKNGSDGTISTPKNGSVTPKNGSVTPKNGSVTPKNESDGYLKPSTGAGSGNPLDLLDQEDQKISLSAFLQKISNEERESFFKFWNKKADELPKPPTLRQAWIEKHWEALWDEFTASRQGTDAKASGRLESVNWRSQPGYPELLQMYNKTPGEFWDFTLPPEDLDYRKAFAKWVIANQIWDIDEELANWEGGYRE